MTYLSTRLKLVCTKYEVQRSITAIVWPIQLFLAQKLGFDTLNAVAISYPTVWGDADHLGSRFCDFAENLFTFAIGGGGRSCPRTT